MNVNGCYYDPDENFNESNQKHSIKDAIQGFSKEKISNIFSKCPFLLVGIYGSIENWLNCVTYEFDKAAKSALKKEIREKMKGAEKENRGWCEDYCLAYCDRNDDENPNRGADYGKDCGCSGIRGEN